MFGFQKLDVYRCAVEFLPIAYRLAKLGDSEIGGQLRRAALSISLNIAEGTGRFDKDQRKFLITSRGSALECAAVIDAMIVLEIRSDELRVGHALLQRIVAMLTKMIA